MSMPTRVGEIRLGGNENPFDPSPTVVEAIRSASLKANRYPDAGSTSLVNALAEHLRVPPEGIVIGNGSDEIIHLLGLAFLRYPSDEIVTGDPSFIRYDAAAAVAACRLIKADLDSNHRFDLPALAALVTSKTKLVFVANPNNPTGTIVGTSALKSFLQSLPEGVVVVLDEAYFEFAANDRDYPNGIDLARSDDRIVVLRTFSKAYGLAGLRIGYAVAPPKVAARLHALRGPFNVNSVAQAAALAALHDRDSLERTLASNASSLSRLQNGLRAMGFVPSDSRANFAYIELEMDADPVIKRLAERGIQVRGGRSTMTPKGLRVGVGLPDEVDQFLNAFGDILEEVRA